MDVAAAAALASRSFARLRSAAFLAARRLASAAALEVFVLSVVVATATCFVARRADTDSAGSFPSTICT